MVGSNNRRLRILILLGGLVTVLGAAFIGMYVWEAIIVRLGEPDQSLLFWYLPILFIGLFLSMGGLVLLIYGIYRNRKNHRGPDRIDTDI